MLRSLVSKLVCPNCVSHELQLHEFTAATDDHVKEGIIICTSCSLWFPIEDELLEFIEPAMMYRKDVADFYERFHMNFLALKIPPIEFAKYAPSQALTQSEQRAHFDDFAVDAKMSYDTFENLPFMVALRSLLYDVWKTRTKDGDWLLDIGSGNGNSAFKMAQPGLTVIGMDISKNMLKRAVQRSLDNGTHSSVSFFLGDANKLPIREDTFDFAVTAGVLSNLPNPRLTCLQLHRIIRQGGIHFGSENNKSLFRGLFDLLMIILPTWRNKKGDFPEVSRTDFEQWYEGMNVTIRSRCSTYLPPHIFNLLGPRISSWLLPLTDRVFRIIPYFKHQGGLIIFEIRKES